MNFQSVKDGVTGALIALILVFMFNLVWKALNYDHRNTYELIVKQDLKQISYAIKFYYDDNDQFPTDLNALKTYFISSKGIPKFRLPEENREWEFDWIYFPPKQPVDKADINQIMLATPTHWNKNKKAATKNSKSFRIVAYYDGTVKKISEKEYQKQKHSGR